MFVDHRPISTLSAKIMQLGQVLDDIAAELDAWRPTFPQLPADYAPELAAARRQLFLAAEELSRPEPSSARLLGHVERLDWDRLAALIDQYRRIIAGRCQAHEN